MATLKSCTKRSAGSNTASHTETVREDTKRQKSESYASSAASSRSRPSSADFSRASTAENPLEPSNHSASSSSAQNCTSHNSASPLRRSQRNRHRNMPSRSAASSTATRKLPPDTILQLPPLQHSSTQHPYSFPTIAPKETETTTGAGNPAASIHKAPVFARKPTLPPEPKTIILKTPQQPTPVSTCPPCAVNTSSKQAPPTDLERQSKILTAEHSPLAWEMQRQPDTRPISLPELVKEVKGIYIGLVMVETKCIQVDAEQGITQNKDEPLSQEHWRALIALHRTLLHEHHDFMLASQHPSASPPLQRLAQKYAMPARMWRHGIHSFLELLRHRLPESREHMISFIYLAYSMMALLYETVPSFSDIFVECLGDLSRYRMAIEDENQRVRDTWTNVSRRWYLSASDHAPTTGRLYHHLAILARPRLVEQLFFYVKSLCVPIPFASTKESIQTLLDPFIKGRNPEKDDVDSNFTHAHALLFKQLQCERALEFADVGRRCVSGLDKEISRRSSSWIQTGAHYAIVSCGSLMGYGSDDNVFVQYMKTFNDVPTVKAIDAGDGKVDVATSTATSASTAIAITAATAPKNLIDMAKTSLVLGPALALFAKINKAVISRLEDTSCYGYVYVLLTWLDCVSSLEDGVAMPLLESFIPWGDLVLMLNYIMARYVSTTASTCHNATPTYERIERPMLLRSAYRLEMDAEAKRKANGESLPWQPPSRASCDADSKPLPEDWSLRGLLWTADVYPMDFFRRMDDRSIDDEERMMETPSTSEFRKERILWLAWRIAQHKKWLLYDATTHTFAAAEAFRLPSAGGNKAEADGTRDGAGEISLEPEERLAQMELKALELKPLDKIT